MRCSIDHIVLNVEDTEAMIAFYSDLLELEPERLEEYRAGNAPFPSVRLNSDTLIDLFPKKLWQTDDTAQRGRNRLNHICFSLGKATWQDLYRRLRTNNISIEEGPVRRWGARGNGISIYFRDPEQNSIEARYYE